MPEEHSQYSPSRLSRIVSCPGSVDLIKTLESNGKVSTKRQSADAAHGSMLHEATEKYYCNGPKDRNESAVKDLDHDDFLLVRDCADYADQIFYSMGHDQYAFKSENKVSLKQWGLPEVWGTLDYRVVDYMRRHLHIIDWKFGSGVLVNAVRNKQLMAYAAGSLNWPTKIASITLHVVQPAIDHYDTYDLSVDELYEWVHCDLAMAINASAKDTDQFNPSVEACRWCEAKNHCPARMALANEIAAELFNTKEKLHALTKFELVELYKKGPFVTQVIKDLTKFFTSELQLGRSVPGMKLVEGRSNRKWVDEKKTLTWLAANTKIDDLFESKLKSPSKLEKELKSLKTNKDFMKLFHNPPGKVTLAYDEDKREAIEPESKATEVFNEIQDLDKLEFD